MDPRETLALAAKRKGSSLAALSRMIGKNQTYLQQFISKGSPRKLEEDDRKMLARFLGLDESSLGGAKDNSYVAARAQSWLEVPRLDVNASAGPGASGGSEEGFDTFRFSRRWLREQGLDGACLSAIRVVGDSMEPLLREGDEVLVDRRELPFRDGVYVVRLDDSLLVKRVASKGAGRFSLISQNQTYPPIAVEAGEFDLVGRVVWKSGRI